MFVLAGCSKSKTCQCTITQTMPEMGPMVSTVTQNIEKGKCEDMNAESTTTMEDMVMTQTVVCAEK